MSKIGPLLLTGFVQIGYFAIMLQAFIVVPSIQYFRPCACTIIPLEPVNRLILQNGLESSQRRPASNVAARSGEGSNFCNTQQSNKSSIFLDNLELSKDLEQLVFNQYEPVKLCLKIDALGRVTDADAMSDSLSSADEILLGKYIAEHWTFTGMSVPTSGTIEGSYSMTLGTHRELQ